MRDIKIKSIRDRSRRRQQQSQNASHEAHPSAEEKPQKKPRKGWSCFVLFLALIIAVLFGMSGGVVGDKLIIPYLATWPQFENDDFFKSKGTTVTVEKTETIKVEESGALVEAIERVSPSLVSIVKETDLKKIAGDITQNKGEGSGVLITADGLILTNKSIVPDITDDYVVILADGRSFEVKSISDDSMLESVFVKIEADNLPVVELGNSEELRIGEKVVALGSVRNFEGEMASAGIISSTMGISETPDGQLHANVIRTDAKISPKNSGGPLINLAGEIIGINVYASDRGEEEAFVIPIDAIKTAEEQVITKNEIKRPSFGATYLDITPEFATRNNLSTKYGALIYAPENKRAITIGSPADLSGLEEKDIIVSANDQEITKDNPFSSMMLEFAPGEELKLRVLRENQEKEISVSLSEDKTP
ncbi:trypsin-like peptidase domain-containing protein [Patescibacteria group bacterium]|nr:trypsin-like peptidase domain-containing protein [Patescibacteria group bacterium]